MASEEFLREMARLESELKKLETEYNMFFAGRLPRPPWETRKHVENLVKQIDRSFIRSAADRFRFSTLQARFQSFIDLWDRALRAREEGRPGPFMPPPRSDTPEPPNADRTVAATSFEDPIREIGKLQDLYHAVADARRELGEPDVPFHKFAELIRNQVTKMRADGETTEVAFRVELRDGKVRFTARGLKGPQPEHG